jgi:hypothetical protein
MVMRRMVVIALLREAIEFVRSELGFGRRSTFYGESSSRAHLRDAVNARSAPLRISGFTLVQITSQVTRVYEFLHACTQSV